MTTVWVTTLARPPVPATSPQTPRRATYHPTQIDVGRFNALLFPDNEADVAEVRSAAREAGLRFHLDLGYDPRTPQGLLGDVHRMVPLLTSDDGTRRAVEFGMDPEILDLNLSAMDDLHGRTCRAGHDYVHIDVHGDVYRCSRYRTLGLQRLGSALDEDFELPLHADRWVACGAGSGCGNKEDFLHLRDADVAELAVPSLGWVPGPAAVGSELPEPPQRGSSCASST